MKAVTFFGTMSLAVAVGMVPASALVIDDFITAGGVIVDGGGSQSVSNSGAGILGGQRDMMLTSPGIGESESSVDVAPPGTLSFSNASQTSGVLMLTYDGSGSLGGVDLTADGADRFTIIVLDSDIGPTFSIDVTSASGTSSFSGDIPDFVSQFTNLPPFQPAPVPADALFSAFTGTADFTEVTGIKLTFDAAANADLTIDFFGTVGEVPLPASALLLLSGLAGVGLIARRRR